MGGVGSQPRLQALQQDGEGLCLQMVLGNSGTEEDRRHPRVGWRGAGGGGFSVLKNAEREAARGDNLIPISPRERVFLSPVSVEHLVMEIPEKRGPPARRGVRV